MERQKSLADVLPGLAAVMPAYTGSASAPRPSAAPASSGPSAPSTGRQASLAELMPMLAVAMPAYTGPKPSAAAPAAAAGSAFEPAPAIPGLPPRFMAHTIRAEDEGPPIAPRTVRVAILLPEDIFDWNIEWQAFAPDVAGGIRKRLPALFRFAAATYFPEISFEFDEYIFERYNGWPQGSKLASYDCVFVTGAKEGAYDQHVPYVPILEKYIGDNVNVTRWIGLSYGHQTIAWGLYPGGKNVIKNPSGWENAAVESVITPEGQKALKTTKKTYFVHNHHGDAVILTPPGCTQFSFSPQTPVQGFLSDRVFCNEGHIEYSAGIMANWGCFDTLNGAYTLEKFREYLATRVYHPPCDNRLGYLPDAIWLCGKMVGWLARRGVVPSDAELEARRVRFYEQALPKRAAIERELADVEYAKVVERFGGAAKVAAMHEKYRRWFEDGVRPQ